MNLVAFHMASFADQAISVSTMSSQDTTAASSIGLVITDHPVVARNPRPRDFRGFRMPREDESGLASAMAHREVKL